MAGPTVVDDVGTALGAGGPAHAVTPHVMANAATAFRTTTCLARLSTDFSVVNHLTTVGIQWN